MASYKFSSNILASYKRLTVFHRAFWRMCVFDFRMASEDGRQNALQSEYSHPMIECVYGSHVVEASVLHSRACETSSFSEPASELPRRHCVQDDRTVIWLL